MTAQVSGQFKKPSDVKFSKSFESFSFAEESIEFQCRYARTINVDNQMTVGGSQPQPIVGEGDLNYTMVVQVGNLGGTTNININAEHNFDGVAPT